MKVNSDQYGRNPSRCQVSHPYASAVVAGCTVTASGEPEHVKIRLVPHKRGGEKRANRQDLAEFIGGHVDVHTSTVQSFPQAFRLYTPLRKVVREAWESLKSTYGALGLLQMCVAIPAIPYRKLIARQPNQPLAAAA
ncbi:hypothetical protein BK140_30920 [Paenibacillus macerans]|nr:hypothetical protein BK140_30920 [Paenibacillus macerans]